MGFRRNANKAQEQKPAPKQDSKPQGKTTSKSGGKSYYNDILQINESKDGSLYLKLNEFQMEKQGVEILINGKKVTGAFSKDPMVQLEESVEAGRLTEEQADEIAEKIPEFVKANVTLVTE